MASRGTGGGTMEEERRRYTPEDVLGYRVGPGESNPGVYMGIDPGVRGSVSLVAGGMAATLRLKDKSPAEVWAWMRKYGRHAGAAVIERVQGYIGRPTRGNQMFKFGYSAGLLEMALIALGFVEGDTYWRDVPRVWQRALSLPPRGKGETDSKWKGRLAEEARGMFPGVAIVTAEADSILIAEYCRRRCGEGRET